MGKKARYSAPRGAKNVDITQRTAMTAGPTTEGILEEGTPEFTEGKSEFTDAAERSVERPVSRQTFPAAVIWADAVADFLLQTRATREESTERFYRDAAADARPGPRSRASRSASSAPATCAPTSPSVPTQASPTGPAATTPASPAPS